MSDFSPEGGSRLNRKQRRVLEREAKKGAENKPSNPGRREFLKKLGIGLGILGVAGAGGLKLLDNEREKSKAFKERVLEFNWNNIHSQEELRPFLESGVREYLKVTNSTNLTEAQLLEPGRITFYKTTKEFEEAVKKIKPNYKGDNTAYSDFDNNKLFFDIQRLKSEAQKLPNSDGINLARLLFHELGHFDVKLNTSGEQINNPNYYFTNPRTGVNEKYKLYRGFQVYTDSSYFGFEQLEEVVLDTLAHRLLVEKVGLPEAPVSFHTRNSKYYRSGVDLFLPFSLQHIPLNTLYNLHATSDFDGLTKLIGSLLPGPRTDEKNDRVIYNARELFIGIQEENPQRIAATGVHRILR